MSVYLLPHEIGAEFGLTRQQVFALCMERGVPIFEGRIERALFRRQYEAREAERRHKAADSPRWCAICNRWGEHHTDRCPNAALADAAVPWPEQEHDHWPEALLLLVVAVAAIALCWWLLTREVNPCPEGWRMRTTPTATVCTNPRQQPRR
jgi:hypothetical protein